MRSLPAHRRHGVAVTVQTTQPVLKMQRSVGFCALLNVA